MAPQDIPPPDRALWDRFIVLIDGAGVKGERARWYVVRIEEYLHAHRMMSLAGHGPAHLRLWFERDGRDGHYLVSIPKR